MEWTILTQATVQWRAIINTELYSVVPNVTRVLRQRLHLKAYKLSIVQGG
jgi:hypothetical protein